MYVVLTLLGIVALVAVSAVSVFMSGFTGEPFGRIAAKSAFCLLLILSVLYLVQ